jgi:Na+-translocating ferredoxin:NAD+ oxidoreductase RNF subunit RnfB
MDYEKHVAAKIFKNLPQTDCGKCGYKKCVDFAKALLRGKKPTKCHYLTNEQLQAITLILDEYYDV